MKTFFIFIIFLFLCSKAYVQESKIKVKPVHEKKISLFPLQDIRLLDGEFKHIMDLNHDYLLSLEPDRLLSWFRREAGLTPKAAPYPFWESEYMNNHGPLPGHIMGFYLSGMSMMYASTGDMLILDRLRYVLNELSVCQKTGGDGYLLPTINGRHVFEDVVNNEFTTSNPFIHTPTDKTWEPVYVMNKIMLGLYGVYVRCDLPQAKEILLQMADWFGHSILDRLSHDTIQKLLVCEHGSINESFIDVYTLTGEEKYLKWARALNDEDMWVPMADGKDILEGWHANTQIPKFTGFEAVYRYTGDERYTNASRFFWNTVVSKHTWSIGGNSTGEHFFPISGFEQRVELNGGPESCNSVNMLRLTESMYQDYAEPDKIDYYEKVLFNHILANYDPEEGMCTYYTSMKPGHYRIYGTKYDSFWCCTGTGFEQTSKFGQMIYAHDKEALYVNLFIPSSVQWKEGIRLTQETAFPDEAGTNFTISTDTDKRFTLKLRHPSWITSSRLDVRVNGKKMNLKTDAAGYVSIDKIWQNGDRVEVGLPMKISTEYLPGSKKYLSIKYGPIILAAKVDNAGLTKNDFRLARLTVALKDIPIIKTPTFIGDVKKLSTFITRIPGKMLSFKCSDKIASSEFELVPFNRIHWNRYTVYFRHYLDKKDYMSQIDGMQQAEQEAGKLDELTVDRVIITDPKSEKEHRMEAVNSSTGSGWRHAEKGGYFMYQLKVLPGQKQSLCLKFLGSDSGARIFDILVDGKIIETINHTQTNAETKGLYLQKISIPEELLAGKDKITVKLQARNRNTAGGLFDLRVITE